MADTGEGNILPPDSRPSLAPVPGKPKKKSIRIQTIKWSVAAVAFLGIAWLMFMTSWGRLAGVWYLPKLGTPAVPFLRKSLNDEDPWVKEGARDALLEMGPQAEPSLVKSLGDENPDVRLESIDALFLISKLTPEGVTVVTRALQDSDRRVREKAAIVLGSNAPPDSEAVLAALQNSTKDADVSVRARAVQAIGSMGIRGEGKGIVPILIDALNNPEPSVRSRAAEGLGRMGPAKAKEAIPALKKAFEDPDAQVRDEVKDALEELGGKSAGDRDKDEI